MEKQNQTPPAIPDKANITLSLEDYIVLLDCLCYFHQTVSQPLFVNHVIHDHRPVEEINHGDQNLILKPRYVYDRIKEQLARQGLPVPDLPPYPYGRMISLKDHMASMPPEVWEGLAWLKDDEGLDPALKNNLKLLGLL
jgi:hypothetical protein